MILILGSLQFQQDDIFHQPAGIFGKSRALEELKVGTHFLMNYAPQGDFSSAFICGFEIPGLSIVTEASAPRVNRDYSAGIFGKSRAP